MLVDRLATTGVEPVRFLEGPRCLRCAGPTQIDDGERLCGACGAAFDFSDDGIVEVDAADRAFIHGLDREADSLVSTLERLEPPACTEEAIAAHAAQLGAEIGNPPWEGRADLARSLANARGIVLDVGCGFGTISVAVARSAAHVFSLDQSRDRARVIAARVRAEGLGNVTVVHADGLHLPLGDATCDLALLIGVLEWTGRGQDDPLAAQEAVLAEVARVLKPGGTLLVGIENRFGAHYLLGMREEHVRLRFVSLLPRSLAHLYCRLARGEKLTTYTHSRRALVRLLRRSGLEPRLGVALPSYSEPQLSFDDDDFKRAWRFYFRHIYRYASTPRRLLGRVARAAPPRLVAPVAPTLWAVAGKGYRPDRLPTLVTGSSDCRAEIKHIDWEARLLRRSARASGELRKAVPLLDGWTARSWACSAVLRSTRLRRLRTLAGAAATMLGARERRVLTHDVREASLREAASALERLSELPDEHREWCRRQLDAVRAADLDMVRQHGDFAAINLVVEVPGPTLYAVDGATNLAFGIPGIDAVVLATEILCMRDGHDRDLEAALDVLGDRRTSRLPELGRLLWSDFGEATSVPLATALTVVAVLRFAGSNGALRGTAAFLARAASGELAPALARLHSA